MSDRIRTVSCDAAINVFEFDFDTRLTHDTGCGSQSVFVWSKVDPAARVTLPSKKGESARRVTLLPVSIFLHSNGA